MRLKDSVALITGAGTGIGEGIAFVFAQEGAIVVAADWETDGAKDTADTIRRDGGEALAVTCDVSNEAQVTAMVQAALDAYGRIDILVNNAAVNNFKTVVDTTSEEWDHCLAVNLKSIFLCSKYTIPHMQAAGKGVIINMSSVHSHATANGIGAYAASKGGVLAVTRSMAIDYGPTIRVNAIAPGWVLTRNTRRVLSNYPDPDEQLRLVEQRMVMKRIGRPVDIGYAAVFLASDEASFITGTQLFIDGGLTAQLESW